MSSERQEYKGHRIELRNVGTPPAAGADEGAAAAVEPELLIDDKPIRYGRLPDGKYFLHEYAYDWRDDLVDLARKFIDYRAQ